MDLKKIINYTHAPSKNEPWLGFSMDAMSKFQAFLEYFHNIANLTHLGTSGALLFRGHGDAEWDLKPKICRIAERIPDQRRLQLEFEAVTSFRRQAHLYISAASLPARESEFEEWVAIMQHHGAPTRLLDWTMSVNVALYFAASEEPDKDGALWYFNQYALATATKSQNWPPEVEEDIIVTDISKFIEYGLSIESPAIKVFDNMIKFDRMTAQYSIFTVSNAINTDHKSLIAKPLWDSFGKTELVNLLTCIRIPSGLKEGVRSYLSKIGISAATLFPGVDGLGKTVQELFELYQITYFPETNPTPPGHEQ